MKYYKVLSEDGTSCNGGSSKWHLPKSKRPGKWMPVIEGALVPCSNGYHLCRREDLVRWLRKSIYEAEFRGDVVEDDNKIVVREARLLRRLDAWNERAARLYACDCAERALTKVKDPDPRSMEAVRVSRAYADGKATQHDLTVAWKAVYDATNDAVRDTAFTALLATLSCVGRDAFSAAHSIANFTATKDADRRWQTERLFEYLYPR